MTKHDVCILVVVTHPWFMSCSVSSSHMRTCMALPSRMKWKMSSMARLLCSPVVPCISPVLPCLAQHQVYHNHCWVAAPRCAAAQPAQPPAQNWTALTMLAFPRPAAAHVTCVAAGASPASCTLLATATWSENRHNMSTGPQQGRVTGAV